MLNGKLCTPEKISQFTKVCALHDVPLRCGSVKRDTSWFAGFVDAEGYFSIRNKNTLTLSVGQKNKKILQDIKGAFSLGNIYFDKSWDGYNWCITNLPGIKEMNQYFKKFPLKTDKRIHQKMFKRLSFYKDRGYHLSKSPNKKRFDDYIKRYKKWKKI